MSFQEIQTNLQAVEETVQTAQGQLTKALEFAQNARETLEGVADHSAQTEHAEAIGLFVKAEQAIVALRTRLERFHPALANYLGALGVSNADAADTGDAGETSSLVSSSNSEEIQKQTEEQPESAMPSPEEQVSVDKYKDIAAEVMNRSPETAKEGPEFIGEGTVSSVWDAGDGNVIKLPKDSDEYDTYEDPDEDDTFENIWGDKYDDYDEQEGPTQEMHEYRVDAVRALERGKGIPGLEQLVTYGSLEGDADPLESADSLIIVTKKVPGKPLSTMDDAERATITDKDYDGLIRTLRAMDSNDIIPNLDPDNVFYDPDEGFTLIDYSTVEFRMAGVSGERRTVADIATSFGSPLSGTLVKPIPSGAPIPEHALKYVEAIKRNFGRKTSGRLRGVLSWKLSKE